MTIEELKKEIISQIKEVFEKSFREKSKELKLEFTPDVRFGDFALPCFALAKELKMSPAEAAKKLSGGFYESEVIEKMEAVGPYLNLKIKNEILFGSAILEIEKEKEKYGSSNLGHSEKIVVEYLSPNTNKPLHLGHLRNGAVGMALSNILKSQGYEVIRTNLVNDRGAHICKSMLAWMRWGKGETPESARMKGDHFVGKWYVKYSQEEKNNPELEKEAQEMLQKWEAADKEIIKVWKLMNSWVLSGFDETYKKTGFEFDKIFYESETYKLGKDIVEEGLKKNIFRRDENGTVVFDMPEEEFGRDKNNGLKKAALLRMDGTSVYMTQDLGTAVDRAKKLKFSRMVYVVGTEQIFHFQSLFRILKSLGYEWSQKLYHLAYGMVYLPEGKMKSREGTVVDADNLISQVEELALDGIKERDKGKTVSLVELEKRAEKIALGAIKFYLLRVKSSQDIHFNPKESISLEGFTGSYCQYAYARIQGILRNVEKQPGNPDFSLLGKEEELLLVQKLIGFPEEVRKSAEEYNPLRVAAHVYETAKAFNQFYNQHQVLAAENRGLASARLALSSATATVLKKGLALLGIDALERM